MPTARLDQTSPRQTRADLTSFDLFIEHVESEPEPTLAALPAAKPRPRRSTRPQSTTLTNHQPDNNSAPPPPPPLKRLGDEPIPNRGERAGREEGVKSRK